MVKKHGSYAVFLKKKEHNMKIFEIINEGVEDEELDMISSGDDELEGYDEELDADPFGEEGSDFDLETDLDDSAEEILIGAVKDLIKDEASEIETDFLKNKVMDQTGEPFKTSDLIALFNRSETLQHYIEKIDANKVKFNTDMLTATTDKGTGGGAGDQGEATLRSMAARAVNRR